MSLSGWGSLAPAHGIAISVGLVAGARPLHFEVVMLGSPDAGAMVALRTQIWRTLHWFGQGGIPEAHILSAKRLSSWLHIFRSTRKN